MRVPNILLKTLYVMTVGLSGLAVPSALADDSEKVPMVKGRVVLGHVEHVLVGNGVELEAMLSPVHHYSELGVQDLKVTKMSDGERLASFTLRGKKGREEKFSVKVLEKSEGGSKKKKDVVVRLSICLGNYELTPHFRLVDRSKYAQEVRLGRRVLAGRVVIDPSMTHAAKPSCEKMLKKSKKTKKKK